MLRLPRKIAFQNLREIVRKQLKCQFQCGDDSTMNPSMNSSSRTRPFAEVTFRASETHFVLKITTFRAPAIYPDFTEYCACHKKWHSKITKYCACHENDSQHWSSWHMKCHLQCAEQQASPSNLTKYCACHKKWFSWLMSVTYETSFTMRGATSITVQPHQILRLPREMTLMIDVRHIWNVIYNARSNKHHPPTSPNAAPATQNCIPKSKRNCPKTVEVSIPMRGRFDHESEHELVISHPPLRRGYFSRFGDAFCIENYNISRSGYLPRFHRILRLPQKVTLQDHQILRLPRKMTRNIDPRDIWNVIYNARSNKHHPPTSPNTAPATKNDSHDWCPSHMKRHFTMRGATSTTLQPHQILRLPR